MATPTGQAIMNTGMSGFAYPAFLDGNVKRMLIGGQWVDSTSGKTFDSINPSTGEVLATMDEGDTEDINRTVPAARRAFEGPWSTFKPYERQMLLLKLADLVEKHFDEFSRLDTLDMGAPLAAPVRAVSVCWVYAALPEGKQEGTRWEQWQQAGLDDLLRDMSPMEFVLRFTFSHTDMDTNIVGTVNPAHLQDNINALRQGPLPPAVYVEAKRRLDAAGSAPQRN